ncbi:MAG: sensor histidine kinase, partial [Oscillospiraceae bacterium]
MPEHEKKAPGKLRSSLVTRLNTRLFFRLLGIYLGMNLLLLSLCGVGTFLWAENQCAQVADLVETRGVPSAEAAVWMAAGDYTVTALD